MCNRCKYGSAQLEQCSTCSRGFTCPGALVTHSLTCWVSLDDFKRVYGFSDDSACWLRERSRRFNVRRKQMLERLHVGYRVNGFVLLHCQALNCYNPRHFYISNSPWREVGKSPNPTGTAATPKGQARHRKRLSEASRAAQAILSPAMLVGRQKTSERLRGRPKTEQHIAGMRSARNKNYLVTPDEVREAKASLIASTALCELCGERKGAYVDHDHLTGLIRGYLCPPCNTALGALGDNIDGLQKAIRYLERAATTNRGHYRPVIDTKGRG